MRIYLDYNATAPLKPAVLEAMVATAMALDVHNPASIHQEGQKAYGALDQARRQVAACIGLTNHQNIIFTSSGTEANITALWALANMKAIIASPIEHASIMETLAHHSKPVFWGKVDRQGIVDLNYFEDLMRQMPTPFLCAVMWVNNETGAIQPIDKIGALVHQYGGFFLCDAVQALGKLPFSVDQMEVDFLTISAHKIGGPVGVGALVYKTDEPFKPLIRGGTQEMGRRGGTHNLMGIVGLSQACTLLNPQTFGQETLLRDYFEAELARTVGTPLHFFSQKAPRVGNTSCFALEGLSGHIALTAMDLRGIAFSSARSACTARAVEIKPSHVLRAMGVPDAIAMHALRVSLGEATTKDDIDTFLNAWISVHRSCISH